MSPTREIGWILVHSSWLATAVAVLLWIALRATPRRAAATRYVLAVTALGLQFALPLATLWRGADRAPAPVRVTFATDERAPAEGPVGAVGAPAATSEPESTPSASLRSALGDAAVVVARAEAAVLPFLPWAVRLWFVGVVVLALRLLGAWLHASRLRRRGTQPAPPDCIALVAALAVRLELRRRVQVLVSSAVEVPAVVGWLRPVLLVPVSALAGLAPRQLELVLAHELAHVRRHDALVNLVQSVVETLLFYHPAVWWVSRTIREERENCCDDIAVATTGDRRGYATALLALEERRALPVRLAPAADGTAIGPRIRRLLEPRRAHAELPRWVPGALLLSGALLLGLAGKPWGRDDAFAAPPDEHPVDSASERARSSGKRHAPLRPDQIRIHPDAASRLEDRWSWAHGEARTTSAKKFWIGWSIAPLGIGDGNVFFGRLESEPLISPDVVISGRFSSFGTFEGFDLPGVRLPATLGAPERVAVLLLCERRFERAPLRVQATSLKFPIDLEGEPLFWLGPSGDEESLALLDQIDLQQGTAEQRADHVAIFGVHSTSALVVPRLLQRLEASEPAVVRRDAAEWLARHPDARGLAALTAAARGDRDAEVRREAAEAVGEMPLPAAGDSAIALAKTLQDEEARREAVESLGDRAEPRTLEALVELAYEDPSTNVQREAVETLGHRAHGKGVDQLRKLAREHPEPEVRREAIETIGESLPQGAAEAMLLEFLRSERNPDVQREIIETMAHSTPPDRAVEIMREVLKDEPSEDAGREAVECLSQMPGREPGLVLVDTARKHPNPEIRAAAREALDGRPW